ncbi:Uncharacterised protein [Yersinia frederiksenii]|nr:Uncharacterised protein [Yersinia frederiksenii]
MFLHNEETTELALVETTRNVFIPLPSILGVLAHTQSVTFLSYVQSDLTVGLVPGAGITRAPLY